MKENIKIYKKNKKFKENIKKLYYSFNNSIRF